jgi:membrane glycosyltransferase
MESLPSSATEHALDFPGVAQWTQAVPQTRHHHRFAFAVLIALLTLLAGTFEWTLLAAEGWSPVNVLLFTLFLPLFTCVAIGFSQAFFGFLILSNRKTVPSSADLTITEDLLRLPVTAIVVPIYHEDVEAVFARLRVMHDALQSLGVIERFQFFVLSDSTNPEKAQAEELAWSLTAAQFGSDRIFYRRRKVPLNRKSGNIADFCRRWGSQYRYMICLDADSLMSADTLVELVRRMEANHRIGILQTVPQAINGVTAWSRLQQFAMSLYGPIFAAGASFWQQEESNFWGHNAIIRLAPFIQHCALPELPGRSAIGSRPMSHDFVEAALMRRAGWEVHLADDLDGSYEETPPNVTEHLKRDRRWCQGNLQHCSLALARGFRPITRFHFLHGIFSFLASPLLVFVLVLGFVKNLTAAPFSDGFFADVGRAQVAFLLFGFTMLLLLLPKLLALALALRRGRAHEFGGAGKMIASAVLEMVISILLAPVFLFFHAKFVLFSWLGKKVEWHAQQRRSTKGIAWRESWKVFGLTSITGAIVGAITWWLTPGYFLWLLPIVLGWLVAVPTTALVGNTTFGARLRKAGFFLVPAELSPSTEIIELRRAERHKFQPNDNKIATILNPLLHYAASAGSKEDVVQLHREIWATPTSELTPVWREELSRFALSTGSAGEELEAEAA